jgi:hypothetical protein
MEKEVLSIEQLQIFYVETLTLQGYDVPYFIGISQTTANKILRLLRNGYYIGDLLDKAKYPSVEKMLELVNSEGQDASDENHEYILELPKAEFFTAALNLELKAEESEQTLLGKLQKETEELKADFISATEKSAIDYVKKVINNPVEDYVKGENYTQRLQRTKDRRERSFFMRPETAAKAQSEYITKRLKMAEIHYQNSIEKLANRILQKGLIENLILFKTAKIGANIECQITDGTKTVKCWTITAWGEIQRPHYRFLVK